MLKRHSKTKKIVPMNVCLIKCIAKMSVCLFVIGNGNSLLNTGELCHSVYGKKCSQWYNNPFPNGGHEATFVKHLIKILKITTWLYFYISLKYGYSRSISVYSDVMLIHCWPYVPPYRRYRILWAFATKTRTCKYYLSGDVSMYGIN